MIVICTKCQAKFRIADEKIGPRGAKVRCSRCKEIFVVQAARPPADPFAAAPPPPAAPPDPFAAFGAPPVGAPPDPFGGEDPFAALPPPPDPFAAAAPSRPPPDPFAAAAPPPPPDPFAEPSPDPGVRSTLPVTDLADVFGAAAAIPAGAAAPPASPADPFRAPALPIPELEPPSVPFPALDGAPFAAAPVTASGPPPLPDPFAPPTGEPAAAPAAPALEAPGPDDLALEDRLTPPPRPVPGAAPAPEPSLDVGAIDPFAAGVAAPSPFDPGQLDGAALGEGDALEVATPAPSAAAPLAAVPAAAPAPAAREAPRGPEPEPAARVSRRRASRVRAVAVNAVALAALLLVTLAIWAVWHTEGPLEAGSLRPSAILAALRRDGTAARGPWAAHDVGSGLYERERGAPLLFVRGRVLSHGAAPVAGVRVRVEVVRGAEVLARGEALAGAVPTPEELHGAVDPAALARALDAARARAPAEVRPNDSVPFLVTLGDAPADLQGASIRLALSEAARPPPAAAPAPAAAPPPGGAAP